MKPVLVGDDEPHVLALRCDLAPRHQCARPLEGQAFEEFLMPQKRNTSGQRVGRAAVGEPPRPSPALFANSAAGDERIEDPLERGEFERRSLQNDCH
jgi:hypothetical protein